MRYHWGILVTSPESRTTKTGKNLQGKIRSANELPKKLDIDLPKGFPKT